MRRTALIVILLVTLQVAVSTSYELGRRHAPHVIDDVDVVDPIDGGVFDDCKECEKQAIAQLLRRIPDEFDPSDERNDAAKAKWFVEQWKLIQKECSGPFLDEVDDAMLNDTEAELADQLERGGR